MDFLARLGGSALGLTASVKPIIAPLFLPTPSTLGDAAGSAATGTVDGEQTPRSRAWPDRDRPLAHARPLRETPFIPASEPVQRTDSPRHAEPPATAEGRLPAVPDPIAPARHEAPIDRLAGRVSLRDPVLVEPSIAPAIATTGTALRDRAAPAPQDSIAPPPRELVQPEILATRTLPDRQPLDLTATLLDRLRSLRESAPAPASARSPVVRVTIGRIEVRSAPAAAPEPAVDVVRPPAPAFAPPSRLTLEQYLSRNRGER